MEFFTDRAPGNVGREMWKSEKPEGVGCRKGDGVRIRMFRLLQT